MREYCDLRHRSPASAYTDLKKIPGLGVKIGRRTFFDRDIALAEKTSAEMPRAWVPMRLREAQR